MICQVHLSTPFLCCEYVWDLGKISVAILSSLKHKIVEKKFCPLLSWADHGIQRLLTFWNSFLWDPYLKLKQSMNLIGGTKDINFFGHCLSVQFSRSVMSDSSRPHESQHTRPPCPSPTPGVHSDSRPSSQWCHPAISSSVVCRGPAPEDPGWFEEEMDRRGKLIYLEI